MKLQREVVDREAARRMWMRAQGLDRREPFGAGPDATGKAIEHLGYVQIDTINVIERCHHHILFTRIPDYQTAHLTRAQNQTKSVFEYWTHALSYVPTRDYRYFMGMMKRMRNRELGWYRSVQDSELKRVIRLVKREGPISIRDIDDDVKLTKDHPWASRKPSKKALELGFYTGHFVINDREGMLKKYDLAERHFCWSEKPRAASDKEVNDYVIDRALRSQAFISLESVCHLLKKDRKDAIAAAIAKRVKKGELREVRVRGIEKTLFWSCPDTLEQTRHAIDCSLVHVLSPFDPLTILRKRLEAFFDYEHRFEAYLPAAKRVYGYFALPVLIGDRVVAVVDLKTDRKRGKLLVQNWVWRPKMKSVANRRLIEGELDRFENFQLGRPAALS